MKLPNFKYEKAQWAKGFAMVAGADEVGRGALAGPLVAAAVIFPDSLARIHLANLSGIKIKDLRKSLQTIVINDSKKLSAKQREVAERWIKQNCLAWGIGEVSVAFINKHGIVKATRTAFRKALKNLSVDFLLVDAFYIPFTRGIKRKNQLAIVKGDQKSFSIAAASIIAKVYRDNLMSTLVRSDLAARPSRVPPRELKIYKWERNKGYGTREHIKALNKHGATRHHRKAFIRKFLST